MSAYNIEDVHIRAIEWRNLMRVDRLLTGIAIGLAVIGVATLFSADISSDYVGSFALKQIRNIIVALVFAAFVIVCDYRILISAAPLFYIVTIGLLIYVEVRGDIRNNAQSWIDLGFMSLQPSELAKIAIIYMFAWYVQLLKGRIQKLHWFLIAFLIPAIPGVLVLMQPDFGTALTLGPLVFAILFIAGCRWWHLAGVTVLGGVAAAALILHATGAIEAPEGWPSLKENQKTRIESFLDPDADPDNAGWHQFQTQIAIGSGGMWGQGYKQGEQTHHDWVPEPHSDSIFVLFAEEQGFVGATALIALFSVLFVRGLQLSVRARDLPGSLLAVGSIAIIATHVFINIGIAIGLMPVTGLPLPFISYGGSFYITIMICIGTICGVAIRRPTGIFAEFEPTVRVATR